MAKKRGQSRPQNVPEHVKTTHGRQASPLATSEATRKIAEKKRGALPLMVHDVQNFGQHKISYKEMADLRIDTSYQRDEMTNEVNDLITILRNGGMIPDPITIAERTYGDRGRYIVDGQQRFWAHFDCGLPIIATVFRVDSYEKEVLLFHAFNTNRRVAVESRLRSYPGPLGDALRRLNENPESPLFGVVSTSPGSHRISGMILARGLVALLSNTRGNGGLDKVAATFEASYKSAPSLANAWIDAYATLVSRVFRHQRLIPVAAVAFGRACYTEFHRSPGNPRLPSEAQIRDLEKVKWSDIAQTHAAKWTPMVVEKIEKIWGIDVLKESRTSDPFGAGKK